MVEQRSAVDAGEGRGQQCCQQGCFEVNCCPCCARQCRTSSQVRVQERARDLCVSQVCVAFASLLCDSCQLGQLGYAGERLAAGAVLMTASPFMSQHQHYSLPSPQPPADPCHSAPLTSLALGVQPFLHLFVSASHDATQLRRISTSAKGMLPYTAYLITCVHQVPNCDRCIRMTRITFHSAPLHCTQARSHAHRLHRLLRPIRPRLAAAEPRSYTSPCSVPARAHGPARHYR